MKNFITYITLFLLLPLCGYSQSPTVQLSLAEIVVMAKEQSIAARQAETVRETRHWEYKSHLSNYKPQLVLSGRLPDFNNTFQEVIQPDGTIDFKNVSINNSVIDFSLFQTIAATGTTLFANSQIQRFDDFARGENLYNNIPVGIGVRQPLFGFNALKWDQKIEPLRYEESEQTYKESKEFISLTASNRFFDFLIAQVNLQIAQTNLQNNDTIYNIAKERFNMGLIARNDLLQLQLEALKSKKSVASAQQNLEVADLALKSFIGFRGNDKIQLQLPDEVPTFEIDTDKALQEAFVNRSDATGFKRKQIEAERALVQAKKENGFNATITAFFGLSGTSDNLNEIYQGVQDSESFRLSFEVPILDWGRAKSKIETANANKEFVSFEIEQARINFEQEIYTLVTLFNMLKDQLEISNEADQIADERYGIAKDRYLLGDLTITELSIALQEKDQAKRDYITALRDFWETYYSIRIKTLYDFNENKKIL